MDIEHKITQLQILKTELISLSKDEDFLYRVETHNPWFIPTFTQKALDSRIYNYLDADKLRMWLTRYPIKDTKSSVGLILAGNIPLVGFHDILCTYFTTNHIKLKLSSKDSLLTQRVIDKWREIDSDCTAKWQVVEKIEDCNKIIATGSNNSYKYFEYYFKKYKHILRKNRTSLAVLHRDISDEELYHLVDDIFLYFGLGCRNISKLFVEEGFELSRLFESSERYNFLFEHTKYMNNYDYQRTLLLLNKIPHLSNNFLMLLEETSLSSPISVLHYEKYTKLDSIKDYIHQHKEEIQCVIGRDFIPFGQAQMPELWDYADGVDTMEFLLS